MPTLTQHGYLVLADISGFTAFMAGTELEHSHDITRELLELIVSRLTPVLTLASLEGDAVFAFAPEARLSRGETLLELVEAAYAAFKDRQEAIRRRTTCTCRACRSVPDLDLKFLVHHGDYAARSVGSGYELSGLDVNLVRQRLLKNHVSEATGWTGYAVFSEKSLAHLGVRPEALRVHVQSGAYEHIGEVKTFSLNLRTRYQELMEARRVFLSAEAADAVYMREFPAPPPLVWAWLNDTDKRVQWMKGRVWSAGARPGGRTGAGANNHCTHGLGAIVETVLDWRPFDYFTVEVTPPSGNLSLTVTYQLDPLSNGDGTRLHTHARINTPLPRWLIRPVSQWSATWLLRQDFVRLSQLIAEDARREPSSA
jgi:uncharacterized protein YndB with AHSA1/START domain